MANAPPELEWAEEQVGHGYGQQHQQQHLSCETARSATSSSISERLEALEKGWSEQKALVDERVSAQSCKLEITIRDMQEHFMAMLKDQRTEVRKDVLGMMRCTLFDQTVAKSAKLTKMVGQYRGSGALVQETANGDISQSTAFARHAEEEVSDAQQDIPSPRLASPVLTQQLSTMTRARENLDEYIIDRIRCLEERLVTLAEEMPSQLAHAMHPNGQSQANAKSQRRTDSSGDWDFILTASHEKVSKALQSERVPPNRRHSSLQHCVKPRWADSRWRKRLRRSDHSFRVAASICSRKVHTHI